MLTRSCRSSSKLRAEAESQDTFEHAARRTKTEEAIKANIEEAQRKQKEHNDLKHGAASCFNVGSVVLKKDFTRKKRKGGKLDYIDGNLRAVCD